MSGKLNQCCTRFREEMKIAETCLADVGQPLAAAADEKVEGLETRWKNALAKCEAKREQAKGASERVREFLQEKSAEVAIVEALKARRTAIEVAG